MKNRLIILFVLLNSFLLTSCWDRTEVNDLALVTAVGIDKKNEKTFELTVEMNIPRALSGGGGGGGAEVAVPVVGVLKPL